ARPARHHWTARPPPHPSGGPARGANAARASGRTDAEPGNAPRRRQSTRRVALRSAPPRVAAGDRAATARAAAARAYEPGDSGPDPGGTPDDGVARLDRGRHRPHD